MLFALLVYQFFFFFFFFQAEDGIRDSSVTGVQTCALPICARLLQLREPHMSIEEYTNYARSVIALTRRSGARVLLNADPSLVGVCGADGVHLSGRRLMDLSERPLSQSCLVAASCHNRSELVQASQIGG